MPTDDKRAEYARRAEEARDAAKASANDQLKMVLYKIARLWDRMSGGAKILLASGAPALASCCVVTADCCFTLHGHCPHCWFQF